MTRLESCPFCGGEAALRSYRVAEDAMGCHVECTGCRVSTEVFEDAYTPSDQANTAWNTRATPTPSVDAAKEMLATAHDLRNNANGDCGAIQQAIYWEQKARALLDADAVEVVGMALCESALGGKRCPCKETGKFACTDEYPGKQARAAIAAIEPLLRRKHQLEVAKWLRGAGVRVIDKTMVSVQDSPWDIGHALATALETGEVKP